ncbi:M20/M25/M40 family metallo-hydrolase [candidate division KSB1 bacterium]|nr:M20/M25/M40 family metallo-hydrolase [candidate division KSB1 bacterium]
MRIPLRCMSAVVLVCTLAFAGQEPDVTVGELYDHVSFLAADDLEGRFPGTRGGNLAADYIRDQFEKIGLKLYGDNGYQMFQVTTSTTLGDKNSLQIDQKELVLNQDFVPLSFSANTTLSEKGVFVGYGFDIDHDSLRWNDYEDMDVSGKWAVILNGAPDIEGDFNAVFDIYDQRKKALIARDFGAGGVIFVSGEQYQSDDELLAHLYDRSVGNEGLAIIHMKRSILEQILPDSVTLAGLEDYFQQKKSPHSFTLHHRITAETDVQKNLSDTQNVLGFLPGFDAALKNQIIVIGAHYDHLGYGGPGSGSRVPDTLAIHNGADDNASGVAAMLEIAEKLYAERTALKRSVLFIAFAAEEMGLLGSKYYTQNPPAGLADMQYMINLDMIGRMTDSSLAVAGTGTAEGFQEIVEKKAQSFHIHPNLSPEGYGPSDYSAFYATNIPVLSFMTDIHQDYHTPEDDIGNLNFPGIKIVSDYVIDIVKELANRENVLAFQEAGPQSQPSVRRRFKVTLGIMPDIAASDVDGMRADVVIKDRPAFLAGMQNGDIIVAMDGKPVHNIYEYMHRLSDFKPGQNICVKVKRGENFYDLDVKL